MSPQRNVTKTEPSNHQNEISLNWNITETEMSPKRTCHQNRHVIKTEMSPTLKCHHNWNFIKSKISPKLNSQQNKNVTKTKKWQKLKCYQSWHVITSYNVLIIKIWIKKNTRDGPWLLWSCSVYYWQLSLDLLCSTGT